MKICQPESLQEFDDFVAKSLDARICLVIFDTVDLDVLSQILKHDGAKLVDRLEWTYDGNDQPGPIISCLGPQLLELELEFDNFKEDDFVGKALYKCPRLQKLCIHIDPADKSVEFFRQLGKSRVVDLEIDIRIQDPNMRHPNNHIDKALNRYLKLDRLCRLVVWGNVPVLGECRNLQSLTYNIGQFAQPLFVPKSVNKLVLWGCTFLSTDTFQSLTLSNVYDLAILVNKLPCLSLALALATRLDQRVMDRLEIRDRYSNILPHLGPRVGRTRFLDFVWSLTSPVILGPALESGENCVRWLSLRDVSKVDLEVIALALSQPNCVVEKIWIKPCAEADQAACERLVSKYNGQVRIAPLLHGQQIRRFDNPLYRLPVELMRLVDRMLHSDP